MSKVNLTANEVECMSAYKGASTEHVLNFRLVFERCNMDPRLVRRTVRQCARKGLLTYYRGLIDEDGLVAGAGYGLTPAGEEWLNQPS